MTSKSVASDDWVRAGDQKRDPRDAPPNSSRPSTVAQEDQRGV